MNNCIDSEIKHTIQAILGKDVSILPVGNHHLKRNLVHSIRTDDGNAYIFKLFLKKNRWNREVAALSLLSQSEIRCPRLMAYGRLENSTEWIITSQFEGACFSHVSHIVPAENKILLYKDMGRELGKLHQIKEFDFFGNWDENGRNIDCTGDYKAYFYNLLDSVISELYRQELPHKALIRSGISSLQHNIGLLEDVSSARLCHNDFNERNTIVKRQEGRWHFEAIIDFEQSLPSDKDKDIAYVCGRLSLISQQYEQCFLEGYSEFCPIEPSYFRKKDFYQIYFGLYICSWAYKHAPEHYLEGIRLLEKYLK